MIATGAGFVAVGGDASAGADPATTRAWTSSDGDAWTASPLDPDLAPLCIDDVVEGPSLLVAVGSDCSRHAAIAVSRDGGLTWERPAVGSSLTNATALDVVTHGSSGFVAYGQTGVGGIGVWASTDGWTWRTASAVPFVPTMDFSWVSDAVPFGPGSVRLVGGGLRRRPTDLSASGLRRGGCAPPRSRARAAAVAWRSVYVPRRARPPTLFSGPCGPRRPPAAATRADHDDQQGKDEPADDDRSRRAWRLRRPSRGGEAPGSRRPRVIEEGDEHRPCRRSSRARTPPARRARARTFRSTRPRRRGRRSSRSRRRARSFGSRPTR